MYWSMIIRLMDEYLYLDEPTVVGRTTCRCMRKSGSVFGFERKWRGKSLEQILRYHPHTFEAPPSFIFEAIKTSIVSEDNPS